MNNEFRDVRPSTSDSFHDKNKQTVEWVGRLRKSKGNKTWLNTAMYGQDRDNKGKFLFCRVCFRKKKRHCYINKEIIIDFRPLFC